MVNYIVVSLASGIIFGILDGIINANPLAKKLKDSFKTIRRKSINIPAGFIIDIFYGFIMAGAFIVLYNSLPGASAFVKALFFAILIWFFRVFMNLSSQWMMFNISVKTLIYNAVTGLIEMIVITFFYALTLNITP